jgi:tetratricopeptide (TPR) repeat protein
MFFWSRFRSLVTPLVVCSALALVMPQQVRADEELGPAYERGCMRMTRGDFDGAANAFSEAIGMNDQNGLAYLRRGECYYKLNSFDKSIKDFTKAIEIAPDSSKAYIWRGTVNGRAGNDQAAVADYKKAIELDNRLALNYFKSQQKDALEMPKGVKQAKVVGNRIEVTSKKLEENHANDGCVRDYKEAMTALFPNGFTADPATVGTYKEPLTEPIVASEIKIENSPGSKTGLKGNGAVFPGADEYHGPDIKKALTALNEQIRSDSSNAGYFYQRAKIYQKLMKVDDAIRDYDTAISLEPNKSQFYVGKASLFYQLGKPMMVESILQKARSADPTVPSVVKFAAEPYPKSFKWSGNDN